MGWLVDKKKLKPVRDEIAKIREITHEEENHRSQSVDDSRNA
jgi:hypothetical protein